MRTTIDLSEDLLRTAKSIAAAKHQSLSQVIGDLAWKGLTAETYSFQPARGFPVLPVRPGAEPVTPDHVADLLELTDRESID